jgi:hypothetical protein
LFADLEARGEQLKASEIDMKNLFYLEKDAREVLEYNYKQLAHECSMHMELRIVTLSTAINLCRSSTKTARSCGDNSRNLKKPHFPSQGC